MEVHGREGSIKIGVLGKTGSGGKEEEQDKRGREVRRGHIKTDKKKGERVRTRGGGWCMGQGRGSQVRV